MRATSNAPDCRGDYFQPSVWRCAYLCRQPLAPLLRALCITRTFTGRDLRNNCSFAQLSATKCGSEPHGELLVERAPQASLSEDSAEYDQLKSQLIRRAQRAGGFLALYLFLQQGLIALLCSAFGSLAGLLYLRLLMHDVEQYTADTHVPLLRAQQVTSQPLRGLAIGAAAYSQALRPRLLVPVAVGVAVGAFDRLSSQPLSDLQMFDILLGFLCYKAGLFLKLYDDIKPRFDPSKLVQQQRPVLRDLPDIEEDLRVRQTRKRH